MSDLNAEQITALVSGELDAGRFRIARAWLNVLIALEDDLQTKWGPTDSGVPLVNVPVLKYGDRCEAHGYDTYVLDGVTFHRATLGVCTGTSAPPLERKLPQTVMCSSCSFTTDNEAAYLDHYHP